MTWKKPNPQHLIPTQWGWCVSYPEKLKLGTYVDIGFGTYINAKHGVEIGRGTLIGSHVSIYSDNTINGTHGAVKIGKNVRVGSYALILPNADIPDGSFIKAYEIVK